MTDAELKDMAGYAATVPGRAGGTIRELVREVEELRAALHTEQINAAGLRAVLRGMIEACQHQVSLKPQQFKDAIAQARAALGETP